uniref:CRIM domain-containing protein n=1 Tax=Lepeophtheirus salmonis TaxID=72036 RepID=A0A0K2TSX1_LEPSM
MALYDNKLFVLSHIRHSYILSDDTGNASNVLGPGDVDYSFLGSSCNGEENEECRSFDIRSGMSHRLRSNTEIKFEKFKRERRNAPQKTKIISWFDPEDPIDPSVAEQLFILKESYRQSPNASLLTKRISSIPERPHNLFTLYANFDATTSSSGNKTVKVTVFIPQSDNPQLPFTLVILPSTKIHEIIGLVCYKYSQENRNPPLKQRVDSYGLFWGIVHYFKLQT